MRPLGDVEIENRFTVEKWKRQRRTELHVFQRENADRQRRQREGKSSADAERIADKIKRWPVTKQARRNGVADFFDKRQIAAEFQRLRRIERYLHVRFLVSLFAEAEG